MSEKVALISHDAGGAEILAHWIIAKEISYVTVLDGPAKKIFQRYKIDLKPKNLDEAIDFADYIICGSSWQSDLEKRAIKKAKAYKKYSITFLDHWVNYEERFEFEGKKISNEIWVGDKYAFDLATKKFNNLKINLVKNPYFEYVAGNSKTFKSINKKTNQKNLLFLSENLSTSSLIKYGDAKHLGYDEFECLEFTLNNLRLFPKEINQLRVRLHPSDLENKFDYLTQITNLKITLTRSKIC